MDDADAFSLLYEREGEAVLVFLARRTLDVETAVEPTAETFATATSKPIVVVVTVEKGGFGAAAAAPVARQILSQWFFGKPGPYVAGRSRTL